MTQPLLKQLTEQERHTVGMELERLHVLQDKPFTEAKRVMFTCELCTGLFPFAAVCQGIKSLHNEELRAIKVFTIIESIRKFVNVDYHRVDCGHCHKEGAVTLMDTAGAPFALACVCSNGDIVATAQRLVRWNGKDIQESNARLLYKTHASRGIVPAVEPIDENLAAFVASVGGTIVDQGQPK